MKSMYIWGKAESSISYGEEVKNWLPLWVHLKDTFYVSNILWDNWVPETIKTMLKTDLQVSESTVKWFYQYLSGLHDLGKATPDFSGRKNVIKTTEILYERLKNNGFKFSSHLQFREGKEYRHELVGCCLYQNLVFGSIQMEDSKASASLIAGHHGNPQKITHSLNNASKKFFKPGDIWGESINELYELVTSWIPTDELQKFSIFLKKGFSSRSQIILTSLIIFADWVASTEKNFPYIPVENVPNLDEPITASRYSKTLEDFDINPNEFHIGISDILDETSWEEKFRSRFLDTVKTSQIVLTSVQEKLYNYVSDINVDPANVFIVESPMGSGKTEAALVSSEILNKRTGKEGFFFGLPTMATSEAIYGRVQRYLKNLQKETGTPSSLGLLHSKSALSPQYYQAQQEILKSSSSLMLPEGWLHTKRLRLLNPYVVGTIDNFLMLGLKTKYAYWRHLGFSSKTVILDEIHACDEYMLQFLYKSLQWAGYYGCPVIILTATLPDKTREKIIESYALGKESR